MWTHLRPIYPAIDTHDHEEGSGWSSRGRGLMEITWETIRYEKCLQSACGQGWDHEPHRHFNNWSIQRHSKTVRIKRHTLMLTSSGSVYRPIKVMHAIGSPHDAGLIHLPLTWPTLSRGTLPLQHWLQKCLSISYSKTRGSVTPPQLKTNVQVIQSIVWS